MPSSLLLDLKESFQRDADAAAHERSTPDLRQHASERKRGTTHASSVPGSLAHGSFTRTSLFLSFIASLFVAPLTSSFDQLDGKRQHRNPAVSSCPGPSITVTPLVSILAFREHFTHQVFPHTRPACRISNSAIVNSAAGVSRYLSRLRQQSNLLFSNPPRVTSC